jgi:FixJ family two-component response regulator
MAIDRFLDRCIAVHPGLRILMATGFGEIDMRLSRTKPDRFLQKPFTADELRREVEIALAG